MADIRTAKYPSVDCEVLGRDPIEEVPIEALEAGLGNHTPEL